MSVGKRLLFLFLIVITATLTVTGITIFMLYRAAFEEERARLIETAQSQARHLRQWPDLMPFIVGKIIRADLWAPH